MVNDEDDAEPTGIHKFRRPRPAPSSPPVSSGSRTRSKARADEEVAIVTEYSGEPPFSDPIFLRLDPDAPEDSIVLVRRPPESG